MIILDKETVAARLSYERLVPALQQELAKHWQVPQRIHCELSDAASMLLMPAWDGAHIGLKVVNVIPDDTVHGSPSISSNYMLFDIASGDMTALIDGETLTGRRTAAVVALAASFLAPADADHLLIIGSGRIAHELPAAISAVRPIRRVTVWSRNPDNAAALARKLAADGYDASPCTDISKAIAAAPITVCATLATEPIVRGEWLPGGAFLGLVGGFRPQMREADSEAVRRSYVVADTRSGVLAEAGDLLTPIAEGFVSEDHIKADLFELCRLDSPIVIPADQPRLFKCVGHAAQDLIAATLCLSGT